MEREMLLDELKEAYMSSEAVQARVAAGAGLKKKAVDVCVQGALAGFRSAKVVLTAGEARSICSGLDIGEPDWLTLHDVITNVTTDALLGCGLSVHVTWSASPMSVCESLDDEAPIMLLNIKGWGPE